MKAVILAGGRGTRLDPLTGGLLPKPLLPVGGIPLIQRQIMFLARNGFGDIIIAVGHLHEMIQSALGDGSAFGVRFQYIVESQPLGTAGALGLLREQLTEDFWVLYGDLLLDVDMKRMLTFHRRRQALATLFVHPNNHPFDSDLLLLDEESRVCGRLPKNQNRDGWQDNCVNAGFFILSPEILRQIPKGRCDLESDVLFPRIGTAIFGYSSPEYIFDVGTPQRVLRAEADLQKDLPTRRNLTQPQRCVFLDRDGTLNLYKGLIDHPDALELHPNAAEAVRLLNENGFLAVVVTNQPVVARGLCDESAVLDMHRKLQTLLGQQGAYLDMIGWCPHHPDKGFAGENAKYKIPCRCRKPDTLLIEQAAERFHIDLSQSWIVGDTTVDIQTGQNAGLHTALVRCGMGGRDGKYAVEADMVCEDVLQAVRLILEKN